MLANLKKAITEGGGLSELRSYLAAGGDVNARLPGSGSTLLHLAVEFQDLPLVGALVEAGADLQALGGGENGWTPLHHAVDIDIDSAGQATLWEQDDFIRELTFATAALLLRLGADPNALDCKGNRPRDQAARYGPHVVDKFDVLVSST